MKKVSSKFILLLASFTMLLASCSYKTSDKPSKRDDSEIIPISPDDIFDDLDLGPGKEIEDKSYFHSNHVSDVSPDYRVIVGLKDTNDALVRNKLMYAPSEMMNVVDDEGKVFDVVASPVTIDGKDYFEVTPTKGKYEEGSVCKIKLKSEDLCFKDKDPEMDTLYYNIDKDNTSFFNISKDVPFFDISNVTYFPVADQEYPSVDDMNSREAADYFANATFHFGYKDNSFDTLISGKEFGISKLDKNGRPDVISEKNTFYGKFIKCEKEGAAFKITYSNADLTKIFKDDNTGDLAYDVYHKQEKGEMKNINVQATKTQLKNALFNDPGFRKYIAALAAVTEVTPMDIVSNLSVDPTFGYKDNTLSIQLKVSGIIPFGRNSQYAIKVTVTFQWAISLSATGGIEVKTALGIPYDLKASGTVTKTTDFKFSFEVALIVDFRPEDPDLNKPIKDKIKEAYNKLENDPAYFMPRVDDPAIYTANHMSQPLCSLDFPIGGLFDLRVQLSFELTIDLNVFFRYGYQTHEVETMLSFTSDDGVENTTNKQSCSSYTHEIEVGGNIVIELGLRVTVSFGFAGLTTLFSLGGYVEGGLYLSIRAMGGITWGDNQETMWFGSFDFEIGFYGKIGVFMDFLFIFHPKFEFKGTIPWFGYDVPITVMDSLAEHVTLTDLVTPIDGTNLLTFKTFDKEAFTIDIRTYRLDTELEVMGENIKPFKLECDSEFITIDEATNTIVVDPKAPDYFEGNFTITVDKSVNFKDSERRLEYEVGFTYKNKDAHEVKFGENGPSLYVKEGKTFSFPDAKAERGLGEEVKFTNVEYKRNPSTGVYEASFGFKYDPDYYEFRTFDEGTSRYIEGSTFTMPDHDVTIVPELYTIKYYTVNYYDGNNNLIASYRVKEHTAAPTPSAEESVMEGYDLVGWDRNTTYIRSDVDVYGIYVKRSTN